MTLELIGQSKDLCIHIESDIDMECLAAEMLVSTDTLREIYDMLAKLGAIDAKLYEDGVIWSDNFVSRVADAYRRRSIPKKHGEPDEGELMRDYGELLQEKRALIPENDTLIPENGTLMQERERERERETKTHAPYPMEYINSDIAQAGARAVSVGFPPQPKSEPPASSWGFEEFWAAYPKKRGFSEAMAAWCAAPPRTEDDVGALMAGLSFWAKSEEWGRDGGRYVPNPAKFLDDRRWLERPPPKPLDPFDASVAKYLGDGNEEDP
jgi:hypothetical protein